MRVIAGNAKGLRLNSPRGRGVRPTLDRVRESLFNIIGPRLHDARFLDLFAGTGAIGIEALSRGARWCDFVDNDERTLRLIRKNLRSTGLEKKSRLWKLSLPHGLSKIAQLLDSKYDLIYADPPYNFEKYDVLASEIERQQLLRTDGLMMIEHTSRTSVELHTPSFEHSRLEKYGEAALSFFTITS